MLRTQNYREVTTSDVYYVALSMIPLVGGVIARQLINHCGSAEAVFSDSANHLGRLPGIGPKIRHQLSQRHRLLDEAHREVARCAQQGIQIISLSSDEYPQRLRHIYDAPVVLFYRGNVSLDQAKVVGVVGTRQATDYGRRITEDLIASLAPHEVLIVSGLAYGIDITAHRAALRAGLPTVGVMASGLDIIYPAVHRSDAQQITEQGGLLTESILGTKPDGPRFPARNRIIAGLCDAVVVVEAAEKGGALITARLANDYDREVFAVPGSLHQKYARGCHRLIKEHQARLLTEGEDIIKILNWDLPNGQAIRVPQYHTNEEALIDLNDEEKAVVGLLAEQPAGMVTDDLSRRLGVVVNELAAVLLRLEFKQVVRALPGRKYKLR
ncbi:MAG: DNA-processing protein DprA [Tunicatimonas sp.]